MCTNSLPPVWRWFIVDGVLLAPVGGGFESHHPPGAEGPEFACGICGERVCRFIALEVGYAFVALFHGRWGRCLSLYSAGSGVGVCRFIPLEVGYTFVALFRRRWCTCLSLYSTGGGVRVYRFIPLEVGYVFIALFHWMLGTYCRFIPLEVWYVFITLCNWRWGTYCRFIPLEVGYVFVALLRWRWGTYLSLYCAGGGVRVCRFIPLDMGYVLSLYSTGGHPFSGSNFGEVCLSCFFYILIACRVMVIAADSSHCCCVLSYTCDGQLSSAVKN